MVWQLQGFDHFLSEKRWRQQCSVDAFQGSETPIGLPGKPVRCPIASITFDFGFRFGSKKIRESVDNPRRRSLRRITEQMNYRGRCERIASVRNKSQTGQQHCTFPGRKQTGTFQQIGNPQ